MLTAAPKWLIERPIAHRALHDLKQGRAENSIGAFKAAIRADYAIECDLQISATGEPVVFHDSNLLRMTGETGNVCDFTPDELNKFKLAKTDDGINTLQKHLEKMAGRVPVILELKGLHGRHKDLVEGTAAALRNYDGQVAVMSFRPEICQHFATLLPDIPRGLTAKGDATHHETHARHMIDFDLQFISYDVNALPHPTTTWLQQERIPIITWTVKTPKQVELTRNWADQMTFEGFDPDTLPQPDVNLDEFGISVF
ncbi:MAG: glycerophosphodiester phosphodiesterase [Hyphomicrobiales bacterium]|nr:MAG: glycerophosphodiester phosphodiesterase [Hyphomicrobiales bacterium]